MEITPLGVTFESRTTLKGKILADFIVEFTPRSPSQRNLLKRLILSMDGDQVVRLPELG